MNYKVMFLIVTLGLIVSLTASCGGDSDKPTIITPTMTTTPTETTSPTVTETISTETPPTETATSSPEWPPFTPSPNEPPECEADRQMIQAIVDAYHEETGKWPTSSYEAAKINWIRLIPDWMDQRPETVLCTWTINENPLGQVCRAKHC